MERPIFRLIAGPCVVESRELCFRVAEHLAALAQKLPLEITFKASYRKANRSRLDSFTGIGDAEALRILQDVRQKVGLPVLTDVHETVDVPEAAEAVDVLQIPAFLCRQTDLLLAAGAKARGGVNLKKGQFMSPEGMRHAYEKLASTGQPNIWLTERGTTFGYDNLVVDMTAFPRMKAFAPVVIADCTHATQRPNQASGVSGGDPAMIETLAKAATAAGAGGLFIEVHPQPAEALSDAASMLPLDQLEGLLERVLRVRESLF